MNARSRFSAGSAAVALIVAGVTAGFAGAANAADDETVPAVTTVTEETPVVPEEEAPEAAVTPSMTLTPGSISTADFQNPDLGILIDAVGFEPGEDVVVTATYAGESFDITTVEADDDGAIYFRIWIEEGTAVAGTITVTAVGQTSGVTLTQSATVVGAAVIAPGQKPSAGGVSVPRTNLPVVSG